MNSGAMADMGQARTQANVRIVQIGNFPPPLCGWSMHSLLVHETLCERGVTSLVMDIGPGRRQKGRDCIDVQNGPDYAIKLLWLRLRGFTFHVHVNGDSWKGYLIALLAVLLGRLTGRPAVLTMHAGPVQKYFPRSSGILYWAFRLLFTASGEIICNHEPVRTEIVKYGVNKGRVHPIPAFSRRYTAGEQVAVPAEIDAFAARHEIRIFSYLLFRPEFTIDALWESFAAIRQVFPGAGLLVVGPHQDIEATMASLRQAGIAEHVFMAGNLNHNEFVAVLRRSDVYVRTHLRDGVCSSVLEALDLGVPVVAAADGLRPPSVVTYAPGDSADLTEKLLHVLRDLDAARAAVIKPQLPDYLDQELQVLVGAARLLEPSASS
jgi:glycosyltransferase involved in cell wall biosynthesis